MLHLLHLNTGVAVIWLHAGVAVETAMTACAEAAKEEDGDDAAACRSRHSFGGPFTGLIFRRQLAFNACHAVEAEEKYQPGSPPGSASWLRQPSQNPSCSLHPRTHRCSKESLKDSERRERGNSSERRRDRCGLHCIVTCARNEIFMSFCNSMHGKKVRTGPS